MIISEYVIQPTVSLPVNIATVSVRSAVDGWRFACDRLQNEVYRYSSSQGPPSSDGYSNDADTQETPTMRKPNAPSSADDHTGDGLDSTTSADHEDISGSSEKQGANFEPSNPSNPCKAS